MDCNHYKLNISVATAVNNLCTLVGHKYSHTTVDFKQPFQLGDSVHSLTYPHPFQQQFHACMS